MNELELDKGFKLEESLRKYFLDRRFFTVRGVKFIYKSETVTDIDLWLYNHASSFRRDITIVDIKNKKSPHTLERILWTKGLSTLLGYDHCIVATVDPRRVVVEFGNRNKVTVVNGKALAQIQGINAANRLTEEGFTALLNIEQVGKFSSSWSQKLDFAKSKLISVFGFSSCNYFLQECLFFLEQATINPKRREAATRACYLMYSYFLISLDYAYKDFVFEDEDMRKQAIAIGLQFGNQGKENMERIFKALKMNKQAEQKPTDDIIILSEFFSKADNNKFLFDCAIYFESIAYRNEFISPNGIEPETLSFFMVLLDALRLERKKVMGVYAIAS